MLNSHSLIIALLFFASTSLAAPATQPADSPHPATTQPIKPSDDGSLLLHAREVTIHGTTVRYEPDPHKNTVGFWTKKEDWVSWDFEITKPGSYHVEILQGCGKGSGGADVEFTVENQTLKTTVQDTGGFQNFVTRDIGTLDLKPGVHTITVKPITKPGVAVMDLRSITLKPVTKGVARFFGDQATFDNPFDCQKDSQSFP